MHRFAAALAILATAVVVVAAASADGPSPSQLEAAGWTCFVPPIPVGTRCAPPGLDRPQPNGRPSYEILAFDFGGNFLGTQHLIRGDLYQDQPCPWAGGAYVFRPGIGYYECSHF
jgi:hypothetical protein